MRAVLVLLLALAAWDADAAPVVVAVASSWAAGAIAGAITSTVMMSSFAALALKGAIGFVVSTVLNRAIGSSGKQQSQPTFQAEARDRLQVVRSAVDTRRIVYGQTMVSGPLVYAESAGTNNQDLFLVIPLAGHEVEEIGDVHLNDEVMGPLEGPLDGNVTTGRHAFWVYIAKRLGTATQAAEPHLVSQSAGIWTANHRLAGIAYLMLRLRYSADVFPTGIPNVKAVVKGKKLYDPRTGLTAWSDNWALAVRDYLTADYGLGCSSAEIDDTTFIAAANIADENVSLASGTQKRYTVNGTVNLADRPLDILRNLMSAGAGSLVYSQGKWRIFAGAYTTPVADIDEDWLAGGIQVQARVPRRDLYNAVRGTFSDPDKFWQPTDFPAVTNSTYETQDGGEQIARDIELPFTTDAIRAQRIAKIHLERSRQGIGVVMTCNLKAFKLAVWDTVTLTIDRMGWSSKVFRVTKWSFNPAGTVDLTLAEEASSVYDWAAGNATTYDTAPDTLLPSPFTVLTPGVPSVQEEIYETRSGRGVAAKAIVTTVPVDQFAGRYQFEYKLTSESTYTVLPLIASPTVEILDLEPGRYDFRVKALNGLDVSSAYATLSSKEIFGLSARPATPVIRGLQASGDGTSAILTLEPHPELDVRRGGRWRIRHYEGDSPDPTLAWALSFSIGDVEGYSGDQTIITLPLKGGAYLVKAEDAVGQQSAAFAYIVVKQASVLAFSVVNSITEDTGFAGTKTGMAAVDGVLKLEGAGLIDDIPDLAAISSLDDYGGVEASGTYDFASRFDFGSVTAVRITGTIAGATINVNDLIDDRTENIDSWLDFDGDAGGGSTDAWLEMRETDDDPAGSPAAWSDWKRLDTAAVEARGVELRLRAVSSDAAYNVHINQLRAVAEEVV